VELLPVRKRAAQAGGVAVLVIGSMPLLFGVLELTGYLTYRFRSGTPGWFWWSVFVEIAGGSLVVCAGRRLVRWGSSVSVSGPL